jgi:hypothetical protein
MTVEKSLTIKCYVCQSVTDIRCNDYFNVPFPEAVVDCDLVPNPMELSYKATFCRKIKQKSKCHLQMSNFIPTNAYQQYFQFMAT